MGNSCRICTINHIVMNYARRTTCRCRDTLEYVVINPVGAFITCHSCGAVSERVVVYGNIFGTVQINGATGGCVRVKYAVMYPNKLVSNARMIAYCRDNCIIMKNAPSHLDILRNGAVNLSTIS